MTKRYICQFCARSFSRSEHKLRHERSHTKEKPFHCSICKNGFVRRDLLQRHLRTVHALLQKDTIEENISTDELLLHKPGPISALDSLPTTNNPTFNTEQQLPEQQLPAPIQTQTQNQTHTQTQTQTTAITNTLLTNEKNIITLLTFANRFNSLNSSLDLRNSVSNYLISFGSSFILSNSEILDELPPIFDLDSLHNLTEDDELLHIILCLGACLRKELNDAVILFNKAWSLIIDQITNSKINYNSGDSFSGFVNHLIVLCFIYLNFFISFVNVEKPMNSNEKLELDEIFKKLAIPIDVLFEYLNNIISTHSSTTSSNNNTPPPLNGDGGDESDDVESFYWFAYILLSHYSFIHNKSPSSLHHHMLSKNIPTSTNIKLGHLINNLSMISTTAPANLESGLNSKMKEKIIISGLMNELQMVKFNETNRLHKQPVSQQGIFKDNKSFLHNAIILANKFFNNDQTDISSFGDGSTLDLITLMKRKLMANCPVKYADLINSYVMVPKAGYNWLLLCLTMKEFLFDTESLINDRNFINNEKPIVEFEFVKFISLNLLDNNGSKTDALNEHDLYKNIHTYISTPFKHNFIINNNLGITSLPILLLALVNINQNLDDLKSSLNFPVNKLCFLEFIIGNFLVLFRLMNFFKRKCFQDLPLPMERNWQLQSSNDQNQQQHSSEDDGDAVGDDDDEDESIIMSVIFFVINELGCHYNKSILKAPDEDEFPFQRKRAYSITIGEFNNNNDKMRRQSGVPNLTKETNRGKKKNNDENTIKSQIMDDHKFYFIMKNLEVCFTNWLELFNHDNPNLNKFVDVFTQVLNCEVYSKLTYHRYGSPASTSSAITTPSVFNNNNLATSNNGFDMFNVISPSSYPASVAAAKPSKKRRNNSPPDDNFHRPNSSSHHRHASHQRQQQLMQQQPHQQYYQATNTSSGNFKHYPSGSAGSGPASASGSGSNNFYNSSLDMSLFQPQPQQHNQDPLFGFGISTTTHFKETQSKSTSPPTTSNRIILPPLSHSNSTSGINKTNNSTTPTTKSPNLSNLPTMSNNTNRQILPNPMTKPTSPSSLAIHTHHNHQHQSNYSTTAQSSNMTMSMSNSVGGGSAYGTNSIFSSSTGGNVGSGFPSSTYGNGYTGGFGYALNTSSGTSNKIGGAQQSSGSGNAGNEGGTGGTGGINELLHAAILGSASSSHGQQSDGNSGPSSGK